MNILRETLFWIPLLWHWPFLMLCRLSSRRSIIEKDRLQWYIKVLRTQRQPNLRDDFQLSLLPEYRSLCYSRMGGLRRLTQWYLPGQSLLALARPQEYYGAGLVIHHGGNTRLGAVRMGENCEVWHNVTLGVGSHDNDDRPTIGNHVKIFTGATIAGKVTIGDYAVIGAGCVVLEDIPANAVVYAEKPKIRINQSR